MNIQKMDTWAVLGVEAYPNYWGIDKGASEIPDQMLGVGAWEPAMGWFGVGAGEPALGWLGPFPAGLRHLIICP